MKTHSVLLCVLCAFAANSSAAEIKIAQSKTALDITIDGKSFTTYRFAATADDPAWHRPYFYPVLSADGVEVTSDQWRWELCT